MQPIQIVKIAVIGMGLLIIVGIALLVYGATSRLTRPGTEAPAPLAPSALGPAFGEVRVALPDGCTIVEMVPAGDRLYLRTGPAGTCERILVIESATGRMLGALLLRP
jgi:hypothetical protein